MKDVPYSIASQPDGVLATVRQAGRRRLPARYRTDRWDRPFKSRLAELLRPGLTILDVGAGRRPTVAVSERPADTRYLGLDPDRAELERAAGDDYDEKIVAPVEERVAALENKVDLVLSFFAFEHVRSTEAALENIAAYLRPGGCLLAQLAGANSPFSIANRLLPSTLARRLLSATQDREPDTVFPARYDRCTHSELSRLLADWSEAQVTPLFTGAKYVLFSRALTAAYVGYEEWIYRSDRRDLAPYYLISARR